MAREYHALLEIESAVPVGDSGAKTVTVRHWVDGVRQTMKFALPGSYLSGSMLNVCAWPDLSRPGYTLVHLPVECHSKVWCKTRDVHLLNVDMDLGMIPNGEDAPK